MWGLYVQIKELQEENKELQDELRLVKDALRYLHPRPEEFVEQEGEMVDKNAERILDSLPRTTPDPYSMPRFAPNAFVCIDATGRLNILGEFGLLTIDEDDLNVLDSEDV